jgi:hypothetical protein
MARLVHTSKDCLRVTRTDVVRHHDAVDASPILLEHAHGDTTLGSADELTRDVEPESVATSRHMPIPDRIAGFH